jgi:hypothetical protein
MGVTEEDMDDARAAIVSMMATFATEGDLRRFPLAFQIVTARLRTS